LHLLVGQGGGGRDVAGAPQRDRARLERGDDREDADVQQHDRHQQLNQAEALFGTQTRTHSHVSRHRHNAGIPQEARSPGRSARCMAAFAYSAINAQGLELKGEIHAPDSAAAREQLRIRGLLAKKLDELPASGDDGVRSVFKAVKPKSLQIFSRQFATMIDAGLNVVSALVILEEQTDDDYLAAVVRELRADVEG